MQLCERTKKSCILLWASHLRNRTKILPFTYSYRDVPDSILGDTDTVVKKTDIQNRQESFPSGSMQLTNWSLKILVETNTQETY